MTWESAAAELEALSTPLPEGVEHALVRTALRFLALYRAHGYPPPEVKTVPNQARDGLVPVLDFHLPDGNFERLVVGNSDEGTVLWRGSDQDELSVSRMTVPTGTEEWVCR